LFGGEVTSEDIGAPRILKNLLIGLVIGGVYSLIAGGGGIFSDIRKQLKDRQKEEIKQEVKDGSFVRPFLRALPIIGRFFRPKKKAEETRRHDEVILAQIDRLSREYEAERARQPPNVGRLMVLQRRIDQLVDSLVTEEAAAAQRAAQPQQAAAQAAQAAGAQAAAQPQPYVGPPPVPP
jgi:hypothetical protein